MGSKAATSKHATPLAACNGCAVQAGCMVHKLLAGVRRRAARPVRRAVDAGQALTEVGSSCGSIIVVVSGHVAIRKRDPVGGSVLMELADAGRVLGYEFISPDCTSHTSIEAVARTEVCETPVEGVRNAIASGGAAPLELLQQLVHDVERHQEAFMKRVAIPSHVRLQHALLDLAEHHGQQREDGSWLIRIPVKRRDLSSMVGIRPETFSRIVRSIEDSGLAQFFGRQVIIPNLETLRDFRSELRQCP